MISSVIYTPPGRLILLGRGSITENLSKFVDLHLRPHVTNLPLYIRDTIYVLKNLEGIHLSSETLLVAIDVEALYSSFPHHLGIAAVKHVLSQSHKDHWKIHSFVTRALGFILSHNVFTFGSFHFLQVQGVAMGTCCSPSYTNLYLGEWERCFLADEGLSSLTNHITTWFRYIDDIFLIWEGSLQALNDCMLAINKNNFNLSFTMSHSQSMIIFLEVNIIKNEDGSLSSGLYQKSTAGNTILHTTSAHPQPLVQSIPYSQYYRLKRNFSTDETFLLEAGLLKNRLLNRGYSLTRLKKAFKQANNQSRLDLLFSSKKEMKPQTTRIIPRFNKQHNAVRRIIAKYWQLLQIDPTLNPHIPSYPAVTYRKAKSLKDQLVQSEFVGSFRSDPCKHLGTFTCGGCPLCQYMNTKSNTLLPNGQTYKPQHYANCKTMGVVYLLMCQCNRFYMGKTKLEFHKRAYRHVTSLTTTNPELPLGRHVRDHHHSIFPQIQFLILDWIHPNPRGETGTSSSSSVKHAGLLSLGQPFPRP